MKRTIRSKSDLCAFMDIGNTTKVVTFKKKFHLSYKNKITFFVSVLFNIFTRQSLTDGFWGLHENMNCAFPLRAENKGISTE